MWSLKKGERAYTDALLSRASVIRQASFEGIAFTQAAPAKLTDWNQSTGGTYRSFASIVQPSAPTQRALHARLATVERMGTYAREKR
jgi:hypothetical protein